MATNGPTPPSPKGLVGRILLLLAVLVLALAIGLGMLPQFRVYWLPVLTDFLHSPFLQSGYGLLLFVAAFALISASGVIPASLFALAAGGLYGLLPGLAYSMLGLVLGGLGGFVVSRYLFKRSLRALVENKISLEGLDASVRDNGWKTVGLVRLSPFFPFALVSYAFGVSSVRLGHFLLGTMLGSVAPVFAYVYTGSISKELLLFSTGVAPEMNAVRIVSLCLGLAATLCIVVFAVRGAARTVRAARIVKNGTGPAA